MNNLGFFPLRHLNVSSGFVCPLLLVILAVFKPAYAAGDHSRSDKKLSSLERGFDWMVMQRALDDYVSPGTKNGIELHLVDYQALSKDQSFLSLGDRLARHKPSFTSPDDKLAFYINAYNYFAMRLVVVENPKKSIRDIGNFFRPVWKKTVGSIAGETMSLHHIEHNILRPMGEARIHFAIVCASISCPDLRREIYVGARLNEQLDSQTKAFLNNEQKGVRVENKRLRVSRLFKWFSEDFDSYFGVLAFVRQYRDDVETFANYGFIHYDWQLNSVGRP